MWFVNEYIIDTIALAVFLTSIIGAIVSASGDLNLFTQNKILTDMPKTKIVRLAEDENWDRICVYNYNSGHFEGPGCEF